MKFAPDRPYFDSEKAARDHRDRQHRRGRAGRQDLHRVDQRAFLFREEGTPAEYKGGLGLAIERAWLVLHESGTFVKFTAAAPICSLEVAGTDYS